MKKTDNSPKVSLLMPVYNGAPYLKETLDSVLRQTFTDFELIIINDGSTDDTKTIIEAYSTRDSRIVAVHQDNIGLVNSLNKGLAIARSNLIARIDGDDPSFETRLDEQYQLFMNDKSLVLAGGGFEIIDENGYFIETIHPAIDDRDLRRTLMLRNPFGHAGVMFRKDAALQTGGYSSDFGPTEDYDLWIRLSKLGTLAAIPNPIYRYRINRKGISQSNSKLQAKETKQHIEKQWRESVPVLLSRRELTATSKRLIRLAKTTPYGVGMKEQLLSDNAQIGIKLIRYKHYFQGIRQLLNVASTGRTGIKVVRKRLNQLDSGSFRQSRR